MEYEHIIIKGKPYVRGKSYGQQCKQKIVNNIAYYKNSQTIPKWDDCNEIIKHHYIKAIKKYFPSGFEEMKGIADGAGVTLEEIIVINASDELLKWQRRQRIQNSLNSYSNGGECTGAVCLPKATKSGDVLIGQNWDNSPRILREDFAVILEVYPDPEENIQPFIMLSEVGQLGRTGMNINGFGIVGMYLWSTEDDFDLKNCNNGKGYVPIFLFRRMFIESPTFAIGIHKLTSTPRHVSVNLIIATKEGEALNIELTPSHYFFDYPNPILTHSNHFKNVSFLAKDSIKDDMNGASSLFRDKQLERHLQEKIGIIDESVFESGLMNHTGYPESVCYHNAEEGKEWSSLMPDHKTVASVIYNLTQNTFNICKGPPCKGKFIQYKLRKLNL
jgi:isopenicillin-N N-acyltransferase-like protein